MVVFPAIGPSSVAIFTNHHLEAFPKCGWWIQEVAMYIHSLSPQLDTYNPNAEYPIFYCCLRC